MNKANKMKSSPANQGNKNGSINKVEGVFLTSSEGTGCSKVDLVNSISQSNYQNDNLLPIKKKHLESILFNIKDEV